MKVLIIEDESLAQNELKRLLNEIDENIAIAGCIDSVEDSINWFQKGEVVDLIFLDIQLSDGISFDIFDEVKSKIPVIFTTAYDEYAIKAFELNSIDYLLKPIKKDNLKSALDKFSELKTNFQADKQDSNLEDLKKYIDNLNKKYKDRFLVKIGDQVKFIQVTDVAYFKADDTIVYLYNNDGKRFIIDYKLDQIVNLVEDELFFGISRSYIAHLNSINKISKHLNGRLKISLNPDTGEDIYISRARASEFLNWLDR